MSTKEATPETTISSAVVQTRFLTVAFADGKTLSADNSLPEFKKLKKAIKLGRGDLARKYINAAESIKVWSEGKLTITKDNEVLYDKHTIHPKMHDRILRMVNENASVTTLVRFLDNLYQNPRVEAIQDTYEFLEANHLPLTEDGCFMAYKRVRNDFKDHHSGQFDNSVGKIVSMPREKCELNRAATCSTGLHFCSERYLPSMSSGATILVKVNPKDITSIPSDYMEGKGRCCEYEVVADATEKFSGQPLFVKTTVRTAKVRKEHGAPPVHKKSKPKAKKIQAAKGKGKKVRKTKR